MAKDLLDFSKFKKIFEDEKNTHLKHPKGHTIIVAHVALSPKLKKQIADLPMHPEKMMELAQDIMEHMPHKMAEGGEAKPFKGYNPEKHSRTGGLNDAYREKYNREHGSDLKRPVTGSPKPGSEAAGRKKSFCARMKGVKGPTSEGGELTPKGAALKRWNCHAHGGKIEDDHDEECMHYAKGGDVEKPAVSRIDMNYKDVTKRIPELTEAAGQLAGGKLSAAEYDALVNKHKPVKAYDFVPQPSSREEAINALRSNQREKYGATHLIKAGDPAELRLDIPAYKDHGVWVNSIHPLDEEGRRDPAKTFYNSVSSVKNAKMTGRPEQALRVASGQANKSTFAVIGGDWHPMEEQEAVEKAQKYLKHKDWKQVGYDPERHGYFYDRETMQPIEGAEQVIQIGPLVLAKKPKYGKKEEQLFAEGGDVEMYAKGGEAARKAAKEYDWNAPAGELDLWRETPGSMFNKKGEKITRRSEIERTQGKRGDPVNKEMRARQIARASALAERRYGMPIVPSKGKIINEETGERKQGKGKSPKPDWRSGELESEQTSQAAFHELAHLGQLPLGMGIKEAQTYMDEGSAEAGKLYGGAAKQTQREIQPMAAENPFRRRAGSPAFARPQDMSPIYGESSEVPLRWDHPPRRALDTGEEYATRIVGKHGQPVDLIAQSKNLSDEYYQRLIDEDEGIIKTRGPNEGALPTMSPHALINLRGQGRMAEAEQRLRTRGESRFGEEDNKPWQFAEGGQVPSPTPRSEDAFKRNAKQFEKGFNAGEDVGQSFQNIKNALGFAHGGGIRHYADAGFVDPMTEEEQQYAPQDFGMDMTEPARAPASEFDVQPNVTQMPQQPAEPDFAKMAAENPANPWEQKFKQYREQADRLTPTPQAAVNLRLETPAQRDEWALNKTLQEKQAAEEEQKRAQMQQTRMDTYHQQLEKNNQAKMQALGISAPSRGVAGQPTVGGGPAVVGQAAQAAPSTELPSGFGGAATTKPSTSAEPSTATPPMLGQDSYMKGLGELLGGVYGQGEALAKIEKAKEESLNAGIAEQQKIKANFENLYNSSIEQNNALVDYYMNQQIDPMKVWNDKSAPAKVASAIGLILGGIGGGLTRQENPAMKFLQYQIDKSVETQKMDLGRTANLLNNNINMTKNMSDALVQTRAQVAEIVARQIERDAAKYGDEVQRSVMHQKAGEIRMKNIFGPYQLMTFKAQLQNPQSSDLERQMLLRQIGVVSPDEARQMAAAEVPNYMMANSPVDRSTRNQLNAYNTFDQRASELAYLLKKANGKLWEQANMMLNPTERERIQTIADELLPQLADANGVQVSEGTKKYLQHQISSGNPAGFWNYFVKDNAALKATIEGSDVKHRQLISSTFGEENAPTLFEKNKLRNRRIAFEAMAHQNAPTGAGKKINRTPIK